jgi:hypothetical protein
MRFMKKQAGMDEAAIARAEGVALSTVRQSIQQVETYRSKNSGVEMELAIRDLVISSIPVAKQTLQGLLTAMEKVEEVDPKTGKKRIVNQEDKTTRLEAMRIMNQTLAAVQPKAPLIEQTISQTNQVANLSGAETTEERLRRLRKRAEEHNLLPAEVAAVPQHIDEGYEEGELIDEDDEEEDE